MRLSAKARASRRNAKRSTGPRTAEGKAQVSSNARKHGLSIPVKLDDGAEAQIESMARMIAGENADPDLMELARRVAEAQLDLVRIKEARRLLLEDPEARRRTLSARAVLRDVKNLMKWIDRIETVQTIDTVHNETQRLIEERVSQTEPPSLIDGLGNLAPRLMALDRYEQRATSRRKRAMRAYDAHCGMLGIGHGEDGKARS